MRGSYSVIAPQSVKMEFRKLKLCMVEWQRQACRWSYISVRSGHRQDDPLVFFVRSDTRTSAFAALTLQSCVRNAHTGTGALNKGNRQRQEGVSSAAHRLQSSFQTKPARREGTDFCQGRDLGRWTLNRVSLTESPLHCIAFVARVP